MSEPIIRVKEIAWIRLRSPDLDMAERYLTDFGMVRAERTSDRLYMRGTDPVHHIHITEKGDPRVLAIGYWARSEEDLHKLAREAANASPVETLDEPGGGSRVRLAENNGLGVEVVWGVDGAEPLPVTTQPLNPGEGKGARLDLLRIPVRPSQVKRIAHTVISTPQLENSIAWGRRHLGFVRADDVHEEGDPDTLLGSFNRIDDGENYVDHHVMMYSRNDASGLNHVSFEVADIDDLMIGHDFLKSKYPDLHVWGMGRHTLGSQIFDYWKDPWGRLHEHWTDTDLLNNSHVYVNHPRSKGFRSQWGPQAPQEFRDAASR